LARETEAQNIQTKQEDLVRADRLLSFDPTQTTQKTTRPTIILLLHTYSLAQ
jgi:hypothetical protein